MKRYNILHYMESNMLEEDPSGQWVRFEDVATLRDEVLIWRKLLWVRHGCREGLYGDDGEMQCNKCVIDFKRMTAEQIWLKWEDEGTKKLRAALKSKATP